MEKIFLNSPFFFRSSNIELIAAVPTFLIAFNPNKILFPSTTNSFSLLLIFGGIISIPMILHSSMKCGILPGLSSSESRDAMYSTG